MMLVTIWYLPILFSEAGAYPGWCDRAYLVVWVIIVISYIAVKIWSWHKESKYKRKQGKG